MTLAKETDYIQLRTGVVTALAQGSNQARKTVESIRLHTYWTVGTLLSEYLNGIDRGYGDQTLKRLADDVDIDLRLLYEIVEFRRRIEKVAPGPLLTWSHYRRLIRIADSSVRTRYLEAVIANEWSVRQLEAQIADGALTALPPGPDSGSPSDSEAIRIIAKRGELWVYRLVDKPGVGRALDLGFRVFERISGHDDPGFDVGSLVQTHKDDEGRYHIVSYDNRRRVFSYRATVASIIDADTLWITIDCGFGTVCDQKVRLRGIDSPELKTPAGVRARDFVVRALSQVDQIIVSTTKLDLYDRYLSDILYLPGESDPISIANDGNYLNREIVEAGHARLWAKGPKGL